jgi:hypothetical protein
VQAVGQRSRQGDADGTEIRRHRIDLSFHFNQQEQTMSRRVTVAGNNLDNIITHPDTLTSIMRGCGGNDVFDFNLQGHDGRVQKTHISDFSHDKLDFSDLGVDAGDITIVQGPKPSIWDVYVNVDGGADQQIRITGQGFDGLSDIILGV